MKPQRKPLPVAKKKAAMSRAPTTGESTAIRNWIQKSDEAIEKLTATIAGLRESIVALTEREKVREDHERRLRAVEIAITRFAVYATIGGVLGGAAISAIVSRLMH